MGDNIVGEEKRPQVAGRTDIHAQCYIPACPNIGDIPVSVPQDILWPDGSLLGSYRMKVMLCSKHVERLVTMRSINA